MSRLRHSIAPLSLVLFAGSLAACSSSGSTSSNGSSAGSPSRLAGQRPVAGTQAVVEGQLVPVPDIKMGDPRTIARILDEGKNRNQVMTHLTTFCTTFGPRLTGSSNLENAQRWAVGQLASWGLSNPHMWEWGTIPVRFDRGPSTAQVVTTAPDGATAVAREMAFTTLAWTVGTTGPVRGPVVKMPRTLDELEANRSSLAGAWLLITPDSSNRQGIRGIGGNMNTRYAARKEARQVLARAESSPSRIPPPEGPGVTPDVPVTGRWTGTVAHPAIPGGSTDMTLYVARGRRGTLNGNIVIGALDLDAPIRDAAIENNILTFTWTTPLGDTTTTLTLDADSLDGSSTPTAATADVPSAAATYDLARVKPGESGELVDNQAYILEQVLSMAPAGFVSSSGDERVWTTSASGWRELDLDAMPRDLEIGVSEPDYDYMNSRLSDGRPVTIEVNLNHTLTPGPIPVYDVIAEIPGSDLADEVVIISAHFDSWNGPGSMGTTDNGTGSAVMLEAARILKAVGAQPRRTIRLILWSGEEQGLLGSRAWVQKHKDELAKYSACLVHDGGTNYLSGIAGMKEMRPQLELVFAPILTLSTEMPFKISDIAAFTPIGSDHESFTAAGVPGFFWNQAGKANYTHTHHTQYDTYDAAIPEYQKHSSIVIATGALGLANLPELLTRENMKVQRGFGGGQGGPGGRGGRRLGIVPADDGSLTIAEAPADGLAAKAGMKAGDKIVRIGETKVANLDELRAAMTAAPQKTKVTFVRDGKEQTVDVAFER